jgi:hypothetical protein
LPYNSEESEGKRNAMRFWLPVAIRWSLRFKTTPQSLLRVEQHICTHYPGPFEAASFDSPSAGSPLTGASHFLFWLDHGGFCLLYGMLDGMGNKDKGKRETKKTPKPKPKAAPGRPRDAFAPPPVRKD